jgi:hypothetical protein
MFIMIFLIGTLLGLLTGAVACVRYLRQEMTANVVPRLNLLQLHLDNLEAEVNLALVARMAELSGHRGVSPLPPGR